VLRRPIEIATQSSRSGIDMVASRYTNLLAICVLVLASDVSISQDTIDEDLRDLILNVSEAAHDLNYETLGRLMVEEFRYSFGGSSQREEAIQWYRDHPKLLQTLEAVLSQPCEFTDMYGTQHYICPAAAADPNGFYYEYRAAFRRENSGAWTFVWFIAGD
jgi:hypothetical protein